MICYKMVKIRDSPHPIVEEFLVDPTEFQIREGSDQTRSSQSNKILLRQSLTRLVHMDGQIDQSLRINFA